MELTPTQKSLAIGIPSALILVTLVGMWWFNHEPPLFDPVEQGKKHMAEHGHAPVTGFATTSALIDATDVLLDKRGGYLSNDIMPPWVLLDNVPNWEFGALTQIRDLARAMRNDFSRSQTQSAADPDLEEADPLYHYASSRWIPPATEGRYRKARDHMEAYLERLSDPTQPNAQFYARADNLADWLAIVEKRLGSLSQRLSASAGQLPANHPGTGVHAGTPALANGAQRQQVRRTRQPFPGHGELRRAGERRHHRPALPAVRRLTHGACTLDEHRTAG